MICPECQFDCPAEFAFCPKCGALLQRSCDHCGFQVPAEFAFCPRCGTAVQAGSAEALQQQSSAALVEAVQRLVPKELAERIRATRGEVSHERRMVTILFSDVRGSTAMSESLDPEEVMDMMSGAFDVLIQPIYRYEGTLARLMGDAILAFFGAPIAHEDDPERAIRAALDILQGAQEYDARLEQEQGISGFNVRVGINTGLVVVGEVGSDMRVEYTAMGDAVNLAARMEQNAPPGGILISHDTYRHVRGVFDVSPQEPLTVKGKSQPVLTYLVQSAKPRAFRIGLRGVEGVETRMVGREAELITLQNAYRDAVEDQQTRVVTVLGEAGVGKTRLLDEFNDWIELLPETMWYFEGRAASTTQAVPYYLWRDLFAYRFDILDSDAAATALSKFREGMAGVLEPDRADLVGQLVGFDFAAAGSSAVQALLGSPNFGQLARVYLLQYFRGMAARQPAVLLLEDLQWADDSSLDLVAHVVAEVPAAPLLIVGAARPALFERRPNWGEGQEAYNRLELKALSKRATRSLVEDILQRVEHLPTSLRDLVVEGADGNPYYVEELIKMLIEDGVIVRGEPHWQVQVERLAELRVPPTLTAVLQARLDALPGAEKAVLQQASVVGRLFWDRLVAELAGDAQEGVEIEPLLGALRERELVFQREQSAFADAREYTFKHSILRDVTYETVLRKLRRRYHAQVAEWLEAHAGERLGEYLGLIARHYELAAEVLKAVEYLQRAGEEAYKVGSFGDARDTFRRALELLPTGYEAQRATLLVRMGEALNRLGELSAAAERLEKGLALAKQVADRRVEAAALLALGHVAHTRGDWDGAESHVQAGLALARQCDDVRGQGQAAVLLGFILGGRGQHDQAEAWAKEGLSFYDQIGDRQGVGTALNCLGMLSLLQQELDRAAQYCRQNLALCQEIGDRLGTSRALNDLGEVARKRGDYEQARACYEETLAISSETGIAEMHAIAVMNLGMVYLAQGEDGAAWHYLCDGLRECTAMQATPATLYVLAVMAQLCVRGGEPQRAGKLLGLVLDHPSADAEGLEEAQAALEALRKALPAEEMEAALARGAKLDLEQVVGEILAEG